jgi:hypothetical protein
MFVGCALLHSAACVWNDYLDREVDRLVGKLSVSTVKIKWWLILDHRAHEAPSPGGWHRLRDWRIDLDRDPAYPLSFGIDTYEPILVYHRQYIGGCTV